MYSSSSGCGESDNIGLQAVLRSRNALLAALPRLCVEQLACVQCSPRVLVTLRPGEEESVDSDCPSSPASDGVALVDKIASTSVVGLLLQVRHYLGWIPGEA